MRDNDSFTLVVYVICTIALAYFAGMFYINNMMEVM